MGGHVMRDVGYQIERSTTMKKCARCDVSHGSSPARSWFPSVGNLLIDSLEVESVVLLGHDLQEEVITWLRSK